MANTIKDGEELISKRYIKEKLGRVIEGVPIILDNKATIMYLAIKLGRYKNIERDHKFTLKYLRTNSACDIIANCLPPFCLKPNQGLIQ